MRKKLYDPHFIIEETEAQKNLRTLLQIIQSECLNLGCSPETVLSTILPRTVKSFI